MSEEFFRFPHTPHIVWLGTDTPRDDKVLSAAEVNDLLHAPVVVEEKLDGANLGFSVGPGGKLRAQNRGQYLESPHAGQFVRLPEWIALHGTRLSAALGKNLIAFGEWCAARHSLSYTALPDWWLLFDVYDRGERRFWSTRRRNVLAEQLGLCTVPRVAYGTQTRETLSLLVSRQRSHFRDGVLEGIIVRHEDNEWLLARGKIVRADFTQSIKAHWRSKKIEWNRVTWLHNSGAESPSLK
jgi:ATP-dependent RNA circularization protein (DNA/RNA ligase family)